MRICLQSTQECWMPERKLSTLFGSSHFVGYNILLGLCKNLLNTRGKEKKKRKEKLWVGVKKEVLHVC